MTEVDLDLEIGALIVAALPDGQAVVMTTNNNKVVRVNKQGKIVKHLYTGSDIRGLLVQGSNLFVLHDNGTIVQMQPEDGLRLMFYNTAVNFLKNFGSHNTELCDIDQNVLPLVSYSHGNVYTYNIKSQSLKLHVNNLNSPTSATHGCADGNVVYVVTEQNPPKVHVYNTTWSLITSFGVFGTGYGQMKDPFSAVISDEGYIFVADYLNSRVSIFTSDGQFVKHIITYEGQGHPFSLSLRGKYLWVTTQNGRLTRFIL